MPNDQALRPLYSEAAEAAVLGGLLTDNTQWDAVSGTISGTDFYISENRLVFEHIGALLNSARPADVLTVAESIAKVGLLEGIGGFAFLQELEQNVPSAATTALFADTGRNT